MGRYAERLSPKMCKTRNWPGKFMNFWRERQTSYERHLVIPEYAAWRRLHFSAVSEEQQVPKSARLGHGYKWLAEEEER